MSPWQQLLAAILPTFTVIAGFVAHSHSMNARLLSIEARLEAIEATAFMWDARENWGERVVAAKAAAAKAADV